MAKFEKGHQLSVGNKGNTKITKPFRTALERVIEQAGDDQVALTNVALALLAKAQEGDINAIKEIADRLDGKPSQDHNVKGTGENGEFVILWGKK